MTQMNKKQQEEQRNQEDLALKHGMLWLAGAVVLEALLFLLNRYAINFDGTAQGATLAESLRTVLKVLRVVGAAALVGGAALGVIRMKRDTKALWAGVASAVGAVVLLCAHVAIKYQGNGLRMLYLLVPVLGGLALAGHIYPRDFLLGALPGVAAVLGLWFYRVSGAGVEFVVMVLAAVIGLAGVLLLKKNDGAVKLGGKQLRLIPGQSDYVMPLISGVAAVAVQVLAVAAGSAVAYYLIFAMGAWLFALLVYYTVKLL